MFSSKNDYKQLQIYKGKCFQKQYIKKYIKAFVFDLDETLGSFADLYVLWNGINKVRKEPLFTMEEQQSEFNKLLDLYPEFIRFGIFNILDYLYIKKKKGLCDKIYVYTNNMCNPPWVQYITNYFKYKLNLKEDLFDNIIHAFKINNKVIEVNRTTHEKTHNDFIKCTLLPKSTELCFIDNNIFKDMIHEKVYYIKPRSYYHSLSADTVIQRFLLSNTGEELSKHFDNSTHLREFMMDWFDLNNGCRIATNKNNEVDIFVAQKMMYHVKEFFYLTQRSNKTRKKCLRVVGKNTRKNI